MQKFNNARYLPGDSTLKSERRQYQIQIEASSVWRKFPSLTIEFSSFKIFSIYSSREFSVEKELFVGYANEYESRNGVQIDKSILSRK